MPIFEEIGDAITVTSTVSLTRLLKHARIRVKRGQERIRIQPRGGRILAKRRWNGVPRRCGRVLVGDLQGIRFAEETG